MSVSLSVSLKLFRPTLGILFLLALLLGVAYPWVVTEVALKLVPGSAGGDVRAGPDGTSYSVFIGQNITCAHSNLTICPYRGLFWLRPTMTDYQPFLGAGNETPIPSTDPALYNQTLYYMQEYGVYNVNASLPVDLVTNSESGLDPDIVPEAALVQIPRVAHFTNISDSVLLALVDENVVAPLGGYVGPAYINVVSLDVALLPLEGGKV